jgi:hypothetical protein
MRNRKSKGKIMLLVLEDRTVVGRLNHGITTTTDSQGREYQRLGAIRDFSAYDLDHEYQDLSPDTRVYLADCGGQ